MKVEKVMKWHLCCVLKTTDTVNEAGLFQTRGVKMRLPR